MAYIGKTPTVGNFVKLDALTASATASYTMQVDSVNFSPESVNHMLVSLNGVIQSPTTSYTISGSTLTFASALTSSDSIDFIMVYGNVLDIGTPSDATVTNAKTNFVSTSSAAGLQIKGDGTTDGTLQLNCSQNSHGIKLKSPAHSAAASYTLTFPTTDGNADEFLQTNGSGVLSWATAGGVDSADHWYFVTPVTDQDSAAVVDFNTQISKGSNITASGGRMTVATAGLYAIDFHFSNQSANSDNMSVHLRKNGTRTVGTIYWEGNTEINYMGMHAHVLVQASASDIFDVYGTGYWSGDTNNTATTWFCGVRLGA